MQKTFKNQQEREFQFVEIKLGLKPCHVYNNVLSIRTDRLNQTLCDAIELPKGNYQILCLAKDATEEQAKLIVDKPNIGETVFNGWHLDKLQILIISLGFKQDDNVLILDKI